LPPIVEDPTQPVVSRRPIQRRLAAELAARGDATSAKAAP
jgi:hypothetical protein